MSDKRTQLIEAAIDLFATNGFWNTPTSKITKHAGVSTGTLFNYFESKDMLIDAVYLQLREEQTVHIADGFPAEAAVKARFEHVWFRYIEWGLQNPVRYRLLQQMKLSDLVSSEAHQRSYTSMAIASTFDQAMATGVFGDISAEFLGSLIISQLGAAVNHAMQFNLSDMALNNHITRSFNIFWSGVTQ